MRIEEYFDKIFLINLDRRKDRLNFSNSQLDKASIPDVEIFKGYDWRDYEVFNCFSGGGNFGCTNSHRALLEIISYQKIPRTLILEDDFQWIHGNPQERFSEMIQEVPDDWDMLYLGGHYAEAPQGRIGPHCIRMGRMLTTTAYGVTAAFARHYAPVLCGGAGIDTLYYHAHQHSKCYIFQPRLIRQRPDFSDIQQKICDNSGCMEDTTHENMV